MPRCNHSHPSCDKCALTPCINGMMVMFDTSVVMDLRASRIISTMTPEDMQAWRVRHGLSLTVASDVIGISRRSLQDYLSGDTEIPQVVAMACWGIDYAASTFPDGRLEWSSLAILPWERKYERRVRQK